MTLVIIQMRRRQELQDYLDAQLEKVEYHNAANTFDQLELKLNQIERKLVSLKAEHPQTQTRPTHTHTHHEKECKRMRRKKEVGCQSDTKPKREAETMLVRKEHEAQVTPQKQLNIISKTMSEGHFQTNPISSSGKRKSKKHISSTKPTYPIAYLPSNKSPSLQSTAKKQPKISSNNKSAEKGLKQRYSSQKYLSRRQDGQIIQHLQRDIDLCMKGNAQLKVKVKQLSGYKDQYCKLRDLMNKFERQRKKHQ